MRVRGIRVLAVAVALALGVSSLVAGCGSGSAGGVETSVTEGHTTTTGDTTTYMDSTYGFSFDHPGDWQVDAANSSGVSVGAEPTRIVTVGDPKGTMAGTTGLDLMMVRVYELKQVVDKTVLPQVLPLLEGLIVDYQTQDPTFKIVAPFKETTVGGMPGYEITGTFDQNAKTPMKTTFYFLFSGKIEYQLVVQAAASTWQANQAVFAAFVASFKPGASAN
jgi:hypothetical protein